MNFNFAADLLKDLFLEFNKHNVRYAVLRNYEGLPDSNSSKDVDILISQNDVKFVTKLIFKVSKENNYQIIWKSKLDYLKGFVFCKLGDDKVFSIKLDIFNGFKWRGMSYLNEAEVLNSAIEYNGFKVPRKAHEAFSLIIYDICYAKKVREKYFEKIHTNAMSDIDAFKEIVMSHFDTSLANDIIECVEQNLIFKLVELRPKIRLSIIKNNIMHMRYIRNLFFHIKTEYWDRRRMGILLAFSGPDGAGKSTLVGGLAELFFSLGVSSVKKPHHFLTSRIPSLHQLPGAPKKYARQDYTKPYQSKTPRFLSSTVRLIYYYIAFLFDQMVFLKKERRQNRIIIFDRYYTDLIVDPTRIRIGLRKKIVQALFRFLPKPHGLFIVIADKALILERKQELSEQKLEELLYEYQQLSESYPSGGLVENNGTIGEGKEILYKKVFDLLERHYSK